MCRLHGRKLVGEEVVWSLGELAAGASVTLTLEVMVPANVAMGTVISNMAQAASPDDVNSPVNSNGVDVTVETLANLAIMKRSDTPVAIAGENLAYTITVTNNGPSDAQEVVVTDPIPVGTSFVSADMGGMLENGIVTWNVGALPAGETVTLSLVVLVDANLADGTIISNIARVESPTDPDTPKESDPDETPVDNGNRAMLMLEKSAPMTVIAGNNLTYSFTLTNTGAGPARNVEVRDRIPAGVNFVSASMGGSLDGEEVVWSLGELAAGASVTLTLEVMVPANVAMGTVISNTAQAASPDDVNSPVNSNGVDVTVETLANLAIMKRSDTPIAIAGENLAYTITVTNNGPSDAQEVVVTDPIPMGTTFVSADMGGMLENGIVTWNVGTIPAGETVTLSLVVLVDANLADGTIISNIARVESPTDPDTP
ncbi:COG1361 S-layer family protein, partial [Nitritalea halalkaliphila]|uniref:COG1361 S-layer family protein n=1 Tax=Nitritalea halalkaliphila TaxID=590849 RepID=UPI0012EADB1D